MVTIEELKEKLPHGSGIDADWVIKDRGKVFVAKNSYHAMNENGYYDGWQDFTLIIPKNNPEGFKLMFNGDRYIAKKYMLKDYLEDTFAMSDAIESMKAQNRAKLKKVV